MADRKPRQRIDIVPATYEKLKRLYEIELKTSKYSFTFAEFVTANAIENLNREYMKKGRAAAKDESS